MRNQHSDYMIKRLEQEGFKTDYYSEDEWYSVFDFGGGLGLHFGHLGGKGSRLSMAIYDEDMILDDYEADDYTFTKNLDNNIRKVLEFREAYVTSELKYDYQLKDEERARMEKRHLPGGPARAPTAPVIEEHKMKITKGQLRKTIRRVLEESTFSRLGVVPQADILYLRNLMTSYMGTFGDWDGFCDWYDSLMEDLEVKHGQEMIAFLRKFGLQTCPSSNRDLVNAIMDPLMQEEPMYATWVYELRNNF